MPAIRRFARLRLLASVSVTMLALGPVYAAVVDYPGGSTNNSAIVLSDNSTQLQVITGSATQAGDISEGGGSWSLEKIGAGTLILGGLSDYTGPTTVSAGTLTGGTFGAFSGFSDFIIAADATLDLGGFDQFAGSLAGAGTITNSGAAATLAVGALSFITADTVFAGTIQDGDPLAGGGAISLMVDNFNGSLTLTGANTYTGGTMICDCSTLQIGNGGDTGSILGNVELNGTLVFNRSDTYTFAGDILQGGGFGPSQVVQAGSGTLILTGTNTYVGNTLINAGKLLINNGDALGVGAVVIADAATLGFAADATLFNDVFITGNAGIAVGDSITGEIAGRISDAAGPGSLIKTGGGTLVLASGNDYTGGTILRGGLLVVADDTSLGDVAGGLTFDGGGLRLSNFGVLDPSRAVTLAAGGGVLDVENSIAALLGDITGIGALTVQGADGAAFLVGNNSYAGGTVVTSGAWLAAETDGNFGDAGGSVTLNGGGLIFLDDVTLGASRTMTLGAGGGSISVFAPASEIAGVITGSGSLTVTGDPFFGGGGELILSGMNTYTGGTILQGDAGFGIPALVVITDDRNLGAATGGVSIDTGGIIFDADVTLNASRAITVTGDGALFDVGGNAVTIAGVIGGDGPVGKDGSGILILTGNNTNTGATDIVDGTLQLGDGGTTGSLSASLVTNSGILAFNRSNVLTVSADIIDACGCFGGAVAQIGSGTTILTGTNTYTGGTTISAGALQLGNGGITGSVTGDITNNGGLIINRSDDITFDNIVSGSGSLTQAGTGTTTITGANSYTGNTVVTGGILRLGAGGGLGGGGLVIDGGAFDLNGQSITVATLSGAGGTLALGAGTITLNGAGNTNLTAQITGTGGLVQAGGGVLTLSGNNSFSGGITIASGTVSLAHNNAAGTGAITTTGSVINYANGVSINTAIIINSNTTQLQALAGVTATQAGVISQIGGARPLEKIGGGTLILTGVNTYTGATTVSGGTLAVNGVLNSPVTVASGGTLAGTGSVGSTTVQSGGALSPGNNAIGTLTVNGNLILQAGSSVGVEVNPASADLINAGSVSLNGTLQVLAAPGNYAPVTTYRVLNSTGAIGGTFAAVTSNQSNLAPSLIYSANAVDLRLLRTDIAFGNAYGVTANQIAAGSAVAADGGSALYIAAVNAYAPATIGTMLDGLSGEVHAALRGAMLENSRMLRGAVLGRLSSPSEGAAIWVQGFAEDGVLHSDGNAAEMHRNQAGFVGGFDTMVTDSLRLGIATAFSGNTVNVAARNSRASGSHAAIIAYASWRSGPLALKLGGDYGWSDTSINRAIPVLNETARSDRSGETSEIFAEAGYDLDLSGVSLTPYLGLAHVAAESGAFAETGGLTSLSGGGASFSQTYSTLGLRAHAGSFDLGGLTAAPRLDLGWSHAFDTAIPAERLVFRGTGQSFTVLGAPTGTDAATIGLGLDLALTPEAVLSFGYDGAFSDRGNSHAIRGGLNWTF